MENISYITGVLCISVFVMGLFYQIGWFEKTDKVIRYVIALCVLLTIIKTVKNFSADINFIQTHNNVAIPNYQKEFNDEIIAITQHEIEQLIKTRLDEKNISYNSVSVHILEQNGSVTVNEISVEGTKLSDEELYLYINDIADENTKIKTGE